MNILSYPCGSAPIHSDLALGPSTSDTDISVLLLHPKASARVDPELRKARTEMRSSGSGTEEGGHGSPGPVPVKISHKKDGHQRRSCRFQVSCALPHPATKICY